MDMTLNKEQLKIDTLTNRASLLGIMTILQKYEHVIGESTNTIFKHSFNLIVGLTSSLKASYILLERINESINNNEYIKAKADIDHVLKNIEVIYNLIGGMYFVSKNPFGITDEESEHLSKIEDLFYYYAKLRMVVIKHIADNKIQEKTMSIVTPEKVNINPAPVVQDIINPKYWACRIVVDKNGNIVIPTCIVMSKTESIDIGPIWNKVLPGNYLYEQGTKTEVFIKVFWKTGDACSLEYSPVHNENINSKQDAFDTFTKFQTKYGTGSLRDIVIKEFGLNI